MVTCTCTQGLGGGDELKELLLRYMQGIQDFCFLFILFF